MAPDWFKQADFNLFQKLRNDGAFWAVWLDWYRARVEGIVMRPFSSFADEFLLVDILTAKPDRWWRREPNLVNEEITNLVDAIARRIPTTNQDQRQEIPPQLPASIQPRLIDGKLTNPSRLSDDDFLEGDIREALNALKTDSAELFEVASAGSNIYPNFIRFLEKLVMAIPDKTPDQLELFLLGSKSDVLSNYILTAGEEWEATLSARLISLSLQFERVLDKFPAWREFRNTKSEHGYSDENATKIKFVLNSITQNLRDDNSSKFVDEKLPNDVQEVEKAIPVNDALIENTTEPLSMSNALESVNNLAKALSEIALRNYNANNLAKTVTNVSNESQTSKGNPTFNSELKKFSKDQIKKLAGIAVAGSGLTITAWLISNYPAQFGWLEPVLKFLGI